MYILPGYVTFSQKSGALLVTSQLLQNTVKITEETLQKEFYSLVGHGGCTEINTPLTRFLYEQELLAEVDKVKASLEESKTLLAQDLLVTIMPTDSCNFRCPYCYEDHAPVTMAWSTLEHIKEYIALQAPKFKTVNIGWFGGEPTLCKDMVLNVAHFVKSLQANHTFQYTSNMTTNGYLLTAELFRQFYEGGITNFQITLDGWGHDQTRPLVSGEGTLQTIIDNLTAISSLSKDSYSFCISLRHNILADDRDLSWYDYLNKLFGKDDRFRALICPVRDWGGDSVQTLNLLGDQWDRLVSEHAAYLEKIGMRVTKEQTGPFSKVCYAAYPHSMVFRADGKIEKCTICLDHPKNQIGYVDSEKGVIIDVDTNNLWTQSELKPECYTCPDVLRCLNLRCGRLTIAGGKTDARCPRALSGV